MIIDTVTKIKWTPNNKKYFVDKGYYFTKMHEEFEVKIDDLNHGCGRKILVKCDICGTEKLLSFCKYIKNINNGGYYACSVKCSLGKAKQTCLIKYGHEHPWLNDKVKLKVDKTILERYGVKNISQNSEIKIRKIKTCLKNHGVEYPAQSKKIQEKAQQSYLAKYGYEYPWLNPDVKEKVDKTMIERYGCINPSQNATIMEKTINTQINRYGEIWRKNIPRYNQNSIIYLDMISKNLNIPIQHALNGGEKKLIKYWIDGYIEQYNLCIEWDEKGHNKEYDKKRENYLIKNKGCKFIRIDEEEFLKNSEESILKVTNQIKTLIKLSESF